MDRHLIEVPHDETELACARVVQSFLETGSHYLTNADWGCEDGDHRAWVIVEAESKEEARMIVPPTDPVTGYRGAAHQVQHARYRRYPERTRRLANPPALTTKHSTEIGKGSDETHIFECDAACAARLWCDRGKDRRNRRIGDERRLQVISISGWPSLSPQI